MRVNNSRILRIQNVKFSRYYFYMNTNMWRYLEICISVPLSLQTKSFWGAIFWCSADLLLSVWALWYLWCFFTTHSYQLARHFYAPNKLFWSLVPFLTVIITECPPIYFLGKKCIVANFPTHYHASPSFF